MNDDAWSYKFSPQKMYRNLSGLRGVQKAPILISPQPGKVAVHRAPNFPLISARRKATSWDALLFSGLIIVKRWQSAVKRPPERERVTAPELSIFPPSLHLSSAQKKTTNPQLQSLWLSVQFRVLSNQQEEYQQVCLVDRALIILTVRILGDRRQRCWLLMGPNQ
jgi:hypothetical protein